MSRNDSNTLVMSRMSTLEIFEGKTRRNITEVNILIYSGETYELEWRIGKIK